MSRMPPRFKLEDAAGEALGEDLVGLRVVERKIFDDQLDAAVLLDELQGVLDDGERGQAEEVHLEKAELLEAAHVVLGDDFVFVRLVKRDEFFQRRRRDDDTGRVDATRCAPCLPACRRRPGLLRRGDRLLRSVLEAGLLREGFFQLDVELRWERAW